MRLWRLPTLWRVIFVGMIRTRRDVDVGRVITSRGLCQGLDEWRLSIEWRASGQLVLRIRHCRPCAHDKVYKLEVEELGVIVLDGRL